MIMRGKQPGELENLIAVYNSASYSWGAKRQQIYSTVDLISQSQGPNEVCYPNKLPQPGKSTRSHCTMVKYRHRSKELGVGPRCYR